MLTPQLGVITSELSFTFKVEELENRKIEVMKYYNNIKSLWLGSLLLLAVGASLTSCKDWLDKDPESIVAEDDAHGSPGRPWQLP